VNENDKDAYLFVTTGAPADWKPPSSPCAISEHDKEIIKPRFSVVLVFLDFIIPWVLLVYVSQKYLPVSLPNDLYWLFLGYLFFRSKRALLWAILFYQRYAPPRVRNACLFTPTCSHYMYLAIEKYGVLAGVAKGVSRLLRCRGNNHGDDYP